MRENSKNLIFVFVGDDVRKIIELGIAFGVNSQFVVSMALAYAFELETAITHKKKSLRPTVFIVDPNALKAPKRVVVIPRTTEQCRAIEDKLLSLSSSNDLDFKVTKIDLAVAALNIFYEDYKKGIDVLDKNHLTRVYKNKGEKLL